MNRACQGTGKHLAANFGRNRPAGIGPEYRLVTVLAFGLEPIMAAFRVLAARRFFQQHAMGCRVSAVDCNHAVDQCCKPVRS